MTNVAHPSLAVKPIPTQYKGVTFRSRTEARWAVFFDTVGLEWFYEYEGFETSKGWYLPDFYLPRFLGGSWVEVKPPWSAGIDVAGIEKAKTLAADGNVVVIILQGPPAPKFPQGNVTFGNTYPSILCSFSVVRGRLGLALASAFDKGESFYNEKNEYLDPNAYDTAMSYRFDGRDK